MDLKIGGIYQDLNYEQYCIIITERNNQYYDYEIDPIILPSISNESIQKLIQNKIQNDSLEEDDFYTWDKSDSDIQIGGYLGQINNTDLICLYKKVKTLFHGI